MGHRDLAKKSQALVKSIGANAQGEDIATVVHLAKAVILALSYHAISDVIAVAGDLSDKILVDITNLVSEDFLI
ncbi:NAD(P)-binding domain-containing protein [Gilliamella sp. B3022]|uniref:NAD(P)-binding domain-containing protein n=1 Tax=Gilliamella sp. B3022 TaxID=2817969 RepID=UPI003FCDEA5C